MRLWLRGDNCPKEVRNSFTGKWACLLGQAGFFVGVSHHHMVVGHTHEDIGPLRFLICEYVMECFPQSCKTSYESGALAQMVCSPWSLLA